MCHLTPPLQTSLKPLIPLKMCSCASCTHPQVYIIEANPRASRTVPFVAKAIGHPVAKYASLVMSGRTLPEIGFTEEPTLNHVAVKEAVLPFDKFPGAPPALQGARGILCAQS